MKLTNIFGKKETKKNLNQEDIFNDIKFSTNNQTNKILKFAEVENIFKDTFPDFYKKFTQVLEEYKNDFEINTSTGFYISPIDKLMLIISKKIENHEDINEVYKILLMYGSVFPRNWQKDDFEVKSNKDIIKQKYIYPTTKFTNPWVKGFAYYDYLEVNSTEYGKITIENKKTGEKNKIYNYSGYSNKMLSEKESENYAGTPDFFSVIIGEVLLNIFKGKESLKEFYKIQNIVFCSGYMHVYFAKGVLETYDVENMQLVNRKFFDRKYKSLELVTVDNENIAFTKENGEYLLFTNPFINKKFEKEEKLFEFIYDIRKIIHEIKDIEFEEKERFLEIGNKIISLLEKVKEKDIDVRTISYIFHSNIDDYKYRYEIIQSGDKNNILKEMLDKLEEDIEKHKEQLDKIKANS